MSAFRPFTHDDFNQVLAHRGMDLIRAVNAAQAKGPIAVDSAVLREQARASIAALCNAWFSAENFVSPARARAWVMLDDDVYNQLVAVHAAAEALLFDAKEYDFPDGMGKGAPQDRWDALSRALDALSPESPGGA